MPKKTIQLVFFAVLTAAVSVLLFFVFKPYLGVLFLASIFAVVFYPVYKKLAKEFGDRENLAALATTLLILFFIIIPLAGLSVLLLKEAADLYNSLAFGGAQGLLDQVEGLRDELASLLPAGAVDTQTNLEVYLRNVLSWIISHFDSIFVAVFGGVFNFFLMLVSLYYLLVSGDKIKNALVAWSPLPDDRDHEFLQSLRLSVDALFKGRFLVSLSQGVFIGFGFVIFGIGSPVLWGFVGAIASLIPILGTSLVTFPAVAYLFISGNFGAGIGLLIWSIIAVGLIDNVVSVLFLKGRMNIHPLVVLLSILGGVEVFGVIGFLVGPVIVSAFLALMKIYPFIMRKTQE